LKVPATKIVVQRRINVVHYSRKDSWLVGLVAASIVTLLVAGALLLLLNHEPGRSLLIIGGVIGATVLLLTYPLYYKVTASELIIRCGIWLKQHIPLSAIDLVTPDRNPAGSPAWSLDRLRVDYRKDGRHSSVLISPIDKLSFMQELAANDRGLKLHGEQLTRE
jgi:uncharacterized membrane protein YeaQ/YmgE (transglycosylase-associated protein family)